MISMMNLIISIVMIFFVTGSASYPAPRGPWTVSISPSSLNNSDPRPGLLNAAMEASGGRFWIGKQPATNCPVSAGGPDCFAYSNNATVFIGANSILSDDTLTLDVDHPAGQQGG